MKEAAFQQKLLNRLLDARTVKVHEAKSREECKELMIFGTRQSAAAGGQTFNWGVTDLNYLKYLFLRKEQGQS